jgi:hypothetical protein
MAAAAVNADQRPPLHLAQPRMKLSTLRRPD